MNNRARPLVTHILAADDTRRSAYFYCETLGLFTTTVVYTSTYSNPDIQLSHLSSPDVCILLKHDQRLTTPPPGDSPVLILHVSDLKQLADDLKAENCSIIETHELPWGFQLHILDPAGNRILLAEDW